jgi:hypothetical protein
VSCISFSLASLITAPISPIGRFSTSRSSAIFSTVIGIPLTSPHSPHSNSRRKVSVGPSAASTASTVTCGSSAVILIVHTHAAPGLLRGDDSKRGVSGRTVACIGVHRLLYRPALASLHETVSCPMCMPSCPGCDSIEFE